MEMLEIDAAALPHSVAMTPLGGNDHMQPMCQALV